MGNEDWMYYWDKVNVYIYWYKSTDAVTLDDLKFFYEHEYLSDQDIVDGVYYHFLTKEEYAIITGKTYAGSEPIEPMA